MKITRSEHCERQKIKDTAWMQGFAIALVCLITQPDGPEMARRTIAEGGI